MPEGQPFPTSDYEDLVEAVIQERWGPKHWLHTVVSGVSFLTYLVAVVHA